MVLDTNSLSKLATKKILCPGGYTWNNKGDAALTICMLQELRTRLPYSTFVLLTDTPGLDAQKYGEDVHPMPFDALSIDDSRKIKSDRRFWTLYDEFIGWRFRGAISSAKLLRLLPVSSIFSFIKKHIKFYLVAGFTYIIHHLVGKEFYRFCHKKYRRTIKEFCDCDAVVFVPGGYFITPHTQHTHWLRHVFSLFLAHVLRKPIILYACSIGPFVGRYNQWLAKNILNRADLIILREELSSKILSRLSVNRPLIHVTTDVAFLLKDCSKVHARQLFDKHIENKHPLTLGVSVRHYGFPEDPNPKQKEKEYLDAFAQLIDYAIREYNARVFFMPQGIGPGCNDISTSEEVLDRVQAREHVSIICEDYSPQELKALYGFMDVFIGVRMHANILALSSKTPVIAVAYEPKTNGIMSMLGLEEYVLNIRNLDEQEFKLKLDTLIHRKEQIRDHLSKILPEIFEKASESAIIVSEFLKREQKD